MKYFFFLSIFVLHCNDVTKPKNIPVNAIYNKKTHVYYFQNEKEYMEYFDNGKIYKRCEIKNNVFDGNCIFYNRSTGKVSCIGTYSKGQRSGEWKWFFADGSLYYKQNFTYGKKRLYFVETDWGNEDGPMERYYSDGKLDLKGSFDSGYKNGYWEKYYDNQRQEFTGYYLKDKKIGTWFYYYPNGQEEAIESFDDKGNLIMRKTFLISGETLCEMKSNQSYTCRY